MLEAPPRILCERSNADDPVRGRGRSKKLDEIDKLAISRRRFLISAIATIGILAVPHQATDFLTNDKVNLYVHRSMNGILALGTKAAEDQPRIWSRGMVHAYRWTGDPDQELCGGALEDAMSDFLLDVHEDDPEDPEFLNFVNEPDPSNFNDNENGPQWDEYIDRGSSTADAYSFVRDIILRCKNEDRAHLTELLGLNLDLVHDQLGKQVYLEIERVPLLQSFLDRIEADTRVELVT
jgi:hypothetical protein